MNINNSTSHNAYSVFHDDYLYVFDGNYPNDSLYVYRTNPWYGFENPIETIHVPQHVAIDYGSIHISDDYLYIGTCVYLLSDPSSPEFYFSMNHLACGARESWVVFGQGNENDEPTEVYDISEYPHYRLLASMQSDGALYNQPRIYSFWINDTLWNYNWYALCGFILDETGVLEPVTPIELPKQCQLHPAYPNPFNPVTRIRFDVPEACDVCITVHNILGQEVTQLVNGEMQVGCHEVQFHASGFASGLYFVRMSTPDYCGVQKILLMR